MSLDHIPEWAAIISETLLQSLKERDPYTYGHCRRVSRNATLLAKAAGLSEKDQEIVKFSSIFHDLGKIGIPDSILLKKDRLTPQEEKIMQTHPTKSIEILQPLAQIAFFKALLPGIQHHHERMDGLGYPNGILADQIPLTARIILVADTFDAITTTRPYREGRGDEHAYKELKQFAGRQFDPHVVRIFLKAHPTWGELEEDITEKFVAAHFRRAA